MTIFRTGIKELHKEHKDEIKRTSLDIKKLGSKVDSGQEGIGEDDLLKTLESQVKNLKNSQNRLRAKLSYLNPKKQILYLFGTLILATLSVILALLTREYTFYFFLSLFSTTIYFIILHRLIGIIVEVHTISYEKSTTWDDNIISLLSKLVESSDSYLEKVYIHIDESKLEDADFAGINIEVNKKQKLNIGLLNSELRLAKNIEVGFVFPKEFIINKSSKYSIYTSKNQAQVIRYEEPFIHGKTHFRWAHSPLTVTPLSEGEYQIPTFINAENIKTKNVTFKIKVTPPSTRDIAKEVFEEMNQETSS